jgi:hypothetical protein
MSKHTARFPGTEQPGALDSRLRGNDDRSAPPRE